LLAKDKNEESVFHLAAEHVFEKDWNGVNGIKT